MSAVVEALPAATDALTEVKAYLRLDSDADDGLIGMLLRAATRLCESFTGVQLIARDATEAIPLARDWRRLSLTPVRAIIKVEGAAADGASFALPVGAYAVDIDGSGDGWVRVTAPGAARRALVQYRAGLVEGWNELPEPIRQGIVRLVSHLYTHRDSADDGGPPAAVAALWRPWRRMRLR